MQRRPFLLNRALPFTRVEYLENTGWSKVFLPIYPKAGDVVEVEAELCFTDLSERQAELTNVDPRLHWGVYNESSFYCGIGYNYTTDCGPADSEWHVFRIVSVGEEAGFWLDGTRTYTATPATGVHASTGMQLWCNLNSVRRCLNRKKWLRVVINGKVVMHLIPVLDSAGEPAFYDSVNHCFYYNTGDDALLAGPVLQSAALRRVEYAEGQGLQYCSIPIAVDGSDGRTFTCISDIQFLGTTRELMGFSTNACCYWGANAAKTAYELGGGCELDVQSDIRNTVRYSRAGKTATLECNGAEVVRTTADAPIQFSAYGIWRPASYHIVTDVCCARVYQVSIYEDGAMTHRLLPMVDSLGVCCLYDDISGVSYYSEGEAAFVAGPLL